LLNMLRRQGILLTGVGPKLLIV